MTGDVETTPLIDEATSALSDATTLEEVQRIVRTAARRLVHADGATFVLRDVDRCFYADEDAISPLWKGQRFPMTECISGWAMRHCEAAVIADITVDDRIPQEAYRPTFVRSLVMTPILAGSSGEAIGAIGAYWAETRQATDAEVALLRRLADCTGEVLPTLL